MHILKNPFSVFSLFCFLFFAGNAFGQMSVQTNRASANYAAGETAYFEITSNQSGTATYRLKYDNTVNTISTGSIFVHAGGTVSVPFQSPSPEVVLCEVTLNGNTRTAAAVFDRDNIPLFAQEPADFDQFWNQQKNLAASVPLDPQLTFHSQNNAINTTTYRINLANIDNRRIYGYLSVPTGGTNLPAVINLPPYSPGANAVQPQDFIANRAQAIAVAVSVHNVEPDQTDPTAYTPDNIDDPAGYYYRYALLGTLRMIDYLHTRPDFDGENIILTGESQGGGLAILAAGLDERVDALTVSNPALCRHAAYDNGRASGFPNYLRTSNLIYNNPTHYAQTLNASRYYDAAFFAKRFQGKVLSVIGYTDEVTPAAGTFTAVNEFRGKTVTAHAVRLGHSHPNQYWDGRYDLWRNAVPATVNPPFYTTTGYEADAGTDRETETNADLQLAGQIYQNGTADQNLPVKWKALNDAANVTFGNENARNSTVRFAEPGVYYLRLEATDNSLLAGENIFYTVSDFVKVTVTAATPTGDTQGPGVQLVFAGFSPDGSLSLNVNFNEEITGLTAADFICTNCNIQNLAGSGSNYTVDAAAQNTGLVRVRLPENRVTDASGNQNTASNQISIYLSSLPNQNPCNNFTSGGTISGDESDCASYDAGQINQTAAASGGSGGTQYQWQSAPSLGGTWSNINGATSSNYNPPVITATTFFRRLARRSGCTDYVASNAIVKEITAAEPDNPVGAAPAPTGYCTMSGENAAGYFIEKIEIENLARTSAGEGFGLYDAQIPVLAPGGLYDINLTPGKTGTTNNWVGWIDFNRDGDFDDYRELMVWKSDTETVTAFFEVPPYADPGFTRMRIALRGDRFVAPCSSYAQGEVEDYIVEISDGNAPGGGGSGGGAQVNNYCPVRGTAPWWQWISRVEFADLDVSSEKETYGDFTNNFATVEKGNVYELTLTPDFSWLSYDMFWRTWIDWNGDGDFDDAGETVAEGNGTEAVNFDVIVPANAQTAVTRMRVGMNFGDYPTPCENTERGEFEDYSVNVTGCTPGNNRFGAILELSAYQHERAIDLHWTTNTEYKNKEFILEHSTDGENFTVIDTQESTGAGYLPNVYRSSHADLEPGEQFYRVKQIYGDATFTYSDTERVWFGIDLDAVVPFPNPASDKLNIPLQKYAGEVAEVKIYDTFARLLRISVVNGEAQAPAAIDLAGLPDGIYYLSIKIPGHRVISRAFTILRI